MIFCIGEISILYIVNVSVLYTVDNLKCHIPRMGLISKTAERGLGPGFSVMGKLLYKIILLVKGGLLSRDIN